jgi:hypothetical protein
MQCNRQTKGVEHTIVDFNHKLTVIKVDHDAHRLKAWSLIDGRWQDVDVVEATHKGNVLHDKKLSDYPPLPEGSD